MARLTVRRDAGLRRTPGLRAHGVGGLLAAAQDAAQCAAFAIAGRREPSSPRASIPARGPRPCRPPQFAALGGAACRDDCNSSVSSGAAWKRATHKIRVEVDTTYLADQSDPKDARYVFSYTITIRNEGSVPARLLTRHWIITDSNGKVQEVRGEGVVGEQPYLKPGQGFRYSSGAVLETPVGAMQGSYQMVGDDGEQFDAPIAAFRLAMPGLLALSD